MYLLFFLISVRKKKIAERKEKRDDSSSRGAEFSAQNADQVAHSQGSSGAEGAQDLLLDSVSTRWEHSE